MSNLLLDTNILSELTKRSPAKDIVDWFRAQDPQSTFISAVTVGELARGIGRLPVSRRRTELEEWFASLLVNFEGRIVGVNQAVAVRWGQLVADLEQAGRGYGILDTLIAASAIDHGLTVVTRNTRDFKHTGVRIFNPWQ